MDTESRRKEIMELLNNSDVPLSASFIAKKLSVSRQIIVGDVAILRAMGISIIATPKGYIMSDDVSDSYPYTGTLACKHDMQNMKAELYTIVDFGGTVIDVTVEHSIYGQLSGILNISSRYDVDKFIKSIISQDSKPLSDLTDGIHLHHIGCRNKENFDIIKAKLTDLGIAL